MTEPHDRNPTIHMVFKSHDPYELRIQMEQRSYAMESRIMAPTYYRSCPIINESQKHQGESFEIQWPKYLMCWMFHFWSIRLVRVPPRLSSAIGRQFGLWHPPRVGTGHAKRCFQKEQFRDNFLTLLKWSACFGRGELNIDIECPCRERNPFHHVVFGCLAFNRT